MKRALVITCMLLITVFCGSANAEIQKMNLRIATSNPLTSMHAQTLEKFKAIVEKESNGAITVEAFYGGVLGDEQANAKQIRDGEIHVAGLNTANLAPFASIAGLTNLPYLFPSIDHAKKLLLNQDFITKIGDKIVQQSRIRPMAWLVGGYCYFTNSVKPIKTMEDIRTLKMRTPPTELIMAAYRSWGVEPHPLAWTETFNALQQGVVDGQDNILTGISDQKFWEVNKYLTLSHYRLYTGVMIVNDRWYKKLNDETRALMDKAFAEAAKFEWDWIEAENAKQLQACIDNGMVLNNLDNEEDWLKASHAVWPEYYETLGGEEFVKEVIELVNK